MEGQVIVTVGGQTLVADARQFKTGSRGFYGSRKVTAITEVVGMEGEVVVLTDIFKFDQTGVGQDGKIIGELKPTGIRPIFGPRLEAAGFKLGAEIFMPAGGLNLGQRR